MRFRDVDSLLQLHVLGEAHRAVEVTRRAVGRQVRVQLAQEHRGWGQRKMNYTAFELVADFVVLYRLGQVVDEDIPVEDLQEFYQQPIAEFLQDHRVDSGSWLQIGLQVILLHVLFLNPPEVELLVLQAQGDELLVTLHCANPEHHLLALEQPLIQVLLDSGLGHEVLKSGSFVDLDDTPHLLLGLDLPTDHLPHPELLLIQLRIQGRQAQLYVLCVLALHHLGEQELSRARVLGNRLWVVGGVQLLVVNVPFQVAGKAGHQIFAADAPVADGRQTIGAHLVLGLGNGFNTLAAHLRALEVGVEVAFQGRVHYRLQQTRLVFLFALSLLGRLVEMVVVSHGLGPLPFGHGLGLINRALEHGHEDGRLIENELAVGGSIHHLILELQVIVLLVAFHCC